MKRLAIAVALAVMFGALLSACGGGGGGGTPASSGPATGTFVKEAHKTSVSSWSGVFDAGVSTVRVQNLYSGTSGTTQIFGSGYITKVGFKVDTAVSSGLTCTGVTIKMGHSSLTALTSTYASNVEQGQGSLVTVLQDKTLTMPALSAGDYFTIDLTTPFYFNGVDKLVVDFIRAGTCTDTVDLKYDNTVPANQSLSGINIASATGNLDYPINMEFTFKGGVNTVIAADATGDNGNFIAPGQAGRTQALILASDIHGSGPITGMAIQPYTTTVGGALTGVTVVLAHSAPTTTNLDSNFATNRANSTSATTVVSNMTYSVPANANTPVWIPFNNGSFNYDGSSNILVDIIVSSATGTYVVDYKNVAGNRIVTSSDPGAATGGMLPRLLQPTFRFNGGTIDAGIGANSYSAQVFDGTADGAEIQSLYSASELGTGGNITSISLRLKNDSVAASYGNYTVKIGHTSKTQLSGSDTYASNMDENMTVHSGSFSIPAGLKAGDWITVPLSTPFTYNPAKNLAVLFSSSVGASAGNNVRWASSATQYPLRVVGDGAGGAATPSWTDNGILEIRFHMQ